MASSQVRYDSIWRRIKSDEFAAKLEGAFRDSRDRLAELNNWGSLSWLFPHATATKLAHHYGVEHNALHFLDGNPDREAHRASFRIASHALHWGHVPLSYAGAEGIIRAVHVDTQARQVVEGILADVVAFGALTCKSEDHPQDCPGEVLAGEEPFELYKWLSAWLISKRWKQLWKAVKHLAGPGVSEQEVKKAAIRALVCREDAGYQLLSLCRLADYVPRDLQQAGTAWLTVDIEALWETSPLRPDRAREWSLLEAARDYLEERFFLSPDAQLVHSLAARAIAQGMLSHGITRDSIHSMLTTSLGDDYYWRSPAFTEYHRRRLGAVRKLTKGEALHRSWSHVGTFDRVHVPEMTRLEVEDMFSGRTGRGRLSYPMTANHSVVVESVRRDAIGPDSQIVRVCLHHRDEGEETPARPALDIALHARRRQPVQAGDDVARDLASWLTRERIVLRARPVHRAAGRAVAREEAATRKLLEAVREHPTFSREDLPRRYRRLFGGVFLARDLPAVRTARRILELPLSVLKSPAGRELVTLLRDQALVEANDGGGALRGSAFEAAVAADQLLSPEPCSQRLLVVGATALSSEGESICEWDLLRLDLIRGGDWRLVAVECTVAASTQKENEDRERLEKLRVALDRRFADLCEFQTRFALSEGGQIRYRDASRGFTRT